MVDDDDEDVVAAAPFISAYFAKGRRAWIFTNRGAFSLDTDVRGTWRVEEAWDDELPPPLPLDHRGFFVEEIGLVIGLGNLPSDRDEGCCHVCAIDVDARPMILRHVWDLPAEPKENVELAYTGRLAYLGNGRFCLSRSVTVRVPFDDEPAAAGRGWTRKGKGTSFSVADVTRSPAGGDLQLAKHGKAHCHVWPIGHCGHADFLQPAL